MSPGAIAGLLEWVASGVTIVVALRFGFGWGAAVFAAVGLGVFIGMFNAEAGR